MMTFMKRWAIASFATAMFSMTGFAAHAATQPACDADNGGLTLPAGFCALVAADAVGTARHAVVAPNGDMYIALQGTRKNPGGVMALRDANGDGKFEIQEKFGDGSATGIALRNGYLYVAKVESVIRYKMTPGQLKPSGDPEVLVDGLPTESEHHDKGLAFDGKGFFYINIGSPSNACQSKDRQAGIVGEDPCHCLKRTGASGSLMRTS
jgi:glucose/arabinose dehydrogenase